VVMAGPVRLAVRLAVGLAVGLAMAGAATAVAAQDDATQDLALDEFMAHVFQRNAEQLWAWSAEEVGVDGARSGSPRSDAEWEAAESDALTLRQLAHGLEKADFRPDDPRWVKLAGDLQAAASASAAAAEAKDYAAFSKAGEEINARCVACHWAFAPQLEVTPPPVDTRGVDVPAS
jgi:hypothetical protein